ncbi:DUF2059 domain-containing protein [Neisseria montereyensis]|uniref:DUF2059 domain-containing protein n=1 Tax=Neisseria montereyensis TaxID=2973938 RepID=A0ABT2FA98_9NEIS|nr:DUF2059 domain-containing protein [Neisseria montereyensis]MCS4533128.1 DUF2059 domain-containing protein [Neisseria montereyensis]
MKNKLILAATLLLGATSVWAAEPSTESLERLMKVQQFDKIMDASFQNIPNTTLTDPRYQEAIQSVPANKRAAIKAKLDQYIRNQAAAINNAQTRADGRRIAIDGIRKIYTQEEVDAMIAFYGSPIGQSINAKMPQYMAVVMLSLPIVIERNLQQYDKQNQAKLNREINQIICGRDTCK